MITKFAKENLLEGVKNILSADHPAWMTYPYGTIVASENDEALVLFAITLLNQILDLNRLPGQSRLHRFIKTLSDLGGGLSSEDMDGVLYILIEDRKRAKGMKPTPAL